MRYDHQWHRAQARAGRGQGWDKRLVPQPRPPGPFWFRIGAIAVIGVGLGVTIAQGIRDADQSRYERLMSSVDIASPDAPHLPRG